MPVRSVTRSKRGWMCSGWSEQATSFSWCISVRPSAPLLRAFDHPSVSPAAAATAVAVAPQLRPCMLPVSSSVGCWSELSSVSLRSITNGLSSDIRSFEFEVMR